LTGEVGFEIESLTDFVFFEGIGLLTPIKTFTF
jgi:hypothetical protein